MEILGIEIENPTLHDWLCEFVYGKPFKPFQHGQIQILHSSADLDQDANDWFRVFERLCKHFPAVMGHPSIRNYIVNSFPKFSRFNQDFRWHLDSFFLNASYILSEEEIIQILSNNPHTRRHIKSEWGLTLVQTYLALTA